MHGESPGWTGSPETARFRERLETLEVPQGATRLQVWLSSAGPQQTMGIYAIEDLVVTFVSGDPAAGERSVEVVPATGSLLDTSAGTPLGWARHGTSLGIAQILPRSGRTPLIIMRDDGRMPLGAGSPGARGTFPSRACRGSSSDGARPTRLGGAAARGCRIRICRRETTGCGSSR